MAVSCLVAETAISWAYLDGEFAAATFVLYWGFEAVSQR